MARDERRSRRLALNACTVVARPLPVVIVALMALAGCHARLREHSPPPGSSGADPRSIVGFSADARLEKGQETSRIKLRVYMRAQGPGTESLFRIEGSGPLGGVGVIATGGPSGLRIVVPSKRRYAIVSDLERDAGSGLLGIPISGCDLGLLLGAVTGSETFDLCDAVGAMAVLFAPPRPSRPESIERAGGGPGGVRIRLEWAGERGFPLQARIEALAPASGSVVFTRFRALPLPRTEGGDFFEEPIPAGSREVAVEDLARESAAQ